MREIWKPTAPPALTMKTLDDIYNAIKAAEQRNDHAWDKIMVADRFNLVMNSEAVVDHEADLVWERSPDITGGTNSDGTLTWNSALTHCFRKTVGDRNWWRLPTVEELASLIGKTSRKPKQPALP